MIEYATEDLSDVDPELFQNILNSMGAQGWMPVGPTLLNWKSDNSKHESTTMFVFWRNKQEEGK